MSLVDYDTTSQTHTEVHRHQNKLHLQTSKLFPCSQELSAGLCAKGNYSSRQIHTLRKFRFSVFLLRIYGRTSKLLSRMFCRNRVRIYLFIHAWYLRRLCNHCTDIPPVMFVVIDNINYHHVHHCGC